MILCDTDVLIEYLKDNPQISTILETFGDENLAISIVTYAELIRGALNRREQICFIYSFFQFSDNALTTTEIELNAIAAPLIQGANKPMPAIGIPMAL